MQLTSWGEFVALPENASALHAIRRLARALTRSSRRSPTSDPLFLHGPSGIGKTLLVSTLVRQALADSPALTAQSVSARELQPPADEGENFTDLESCDLLVVEDVQHLPPRAAELLCRLLDRRATYRRPTVLTASTGPANLTALPRRLTSRLAAGLVVQLEPFKPASRRMLLAQAAAKRSIHLTDDALDWLAAQSTGGGIRPLLGQLQTIHAKMPTRLPLPLDSEAIAELLSGEESLSSPSLDRVLGKVCAAFGVSAKTVLGPGRYRDVMVPRQVAMYLAREVAGASLPHIGEFFGGRDHSTVSHAVRKVAAAIQEDAALHATVRRLRGELG